MSRELRYMTALEKRRDHKLREYFGVDKNKPWSKDQLQYLEESIVGCKAAADFAHANGRSFTWPYWFPYTKS